MSKIDTARRTDIDVTLDGVNISADMNKYRLSLTYTDHEQDRSDDLRIEIEDSEGDWLTWLNEEIEADNSAVDADSDGDNGDFKAGDIVYFTGGHHFVASTATVSANFTPRTAGPARLTHTAPGALHPYHVIGGAFTAVEGSSNVYGWVDGSQLTMSHPHGAHLAKLSAVLSWDKSQPLFAIVSLRLICFFFNQ
ncbi:MAG: hypothetical protein FWH20_00545 [Oscillospiraceae bacterium]|nr:hypothetical protein [Oscillospiraceae bacterium]